MKSLLGLAALAMLGGCVGNGEGEEAAKAKQFDKKSYERAMVDSGKSKELREAKEREKAYLAAQGGVEEEQR